MGRISYLFTRGVPDDGVARFLRSAFRPMESTLIICGVPTWSVTGWGHYSAGAS